MERSNFPKYFDICVQKLEGSDKFSLNYFETAVNLLRFLSEDLQISQSELFKKQMWPINNKQNPRMRH
jgi:hypothetical protein